MATKGPWTTVCLPTGCDEAITAGVIGALVNFQTRVPWFSRKAIKNTATVSVFCLLSLVWFCEATTAAQSDTSCGRQHVIHAQFNLGEKVEQKQSYLSCFLKFFRPLWRLGLNVIKRSAKAGGVNQTISKSSCSANPSTVALRIICGKWPGLGVVCHLWGVRIVFGRL